MILRDKCSIRADLVQSVKELRDYENRIILPRIVEVYVEGSKRDKELKKLKVYKERVALLQREYNNSLFVNSPEPINGRSI